VGFVALAFLSSSLAADDFYGSYRNGETAEPEAQVAPVSQPAAETAAPAADTGDLAGKIAALEQENANLRKEIGEIKTDLSGLKNKAAAAVVPASQPAAPAAPVIPAGKNPILANSAIEFYGYAKADAVYSDSQAGEMTMSAPVETRDQKEFLMTAKETRMGLAITGPAVGEDGKVTAKVETDFWGTTTDATTTSQLRIRQAYVDLKYPTWDVLAGQTWDFVAPLNAATLNFSALWRAGNMGDRHPQARVTKKLARVLGGTLTSQVGVIDTKVDDQAHTGKPVAGTFHSFEKNFFGQPLFIGAGGVYGQSDISSANSKDIDLWAATLALKYKLTQKIALIAEGYTGANLAAFRAGSATGVDHEKAVRTRGGFLQLTLDPTAKLQFNAGAGIDDVYTDSTSTGSSAVWDYNYSFFVNAKYQLAKNMSWGLEYQQFKTEFANQNGGDVQRIQSSLLYTF